MVIVGLTRVPLPPVHYFINLKTGKVTQVLGQNIGKKYR